MQFYDEKFEEILLAIDEDEDDSIRDIGMHNNIDDFYDLNHSNMSDEQKNSILNQLNNQTNMELTKEQLDEILKVIHEKKFSDIADLMNKTSSINTDVQSIPISQVEVIYYERKVKPLLDIIFSLSYQIENLAAASSFYQANAFGKKHRVKKAVNLSNDMLDIMEDILCLVEKRIEIFTKNINPYK